MTLDPSEYSVDDLKDELEVVNDVDDLQTIHEAEAEGKDRKTAKKAIKRRINAVVEELESEMEAAAEEDEDEETTTEEIEEDEAEDEETTTEEIEEDEAEDEETTTEDEAEGGEGGSSRSSPTIRL